MDAEIFRKYEYDLFVEDSMFIQYSNDPVRLDPPPGYEPRSKEQIFTASMGSAGERVAEVAEIIEGAGSYYSDDRNKDSERSLVASDYEVELAARAYEKLFANREFSLHGLKAEVLEQTLEDWKLEIAEERKIDDVIDGLTYEDADRDELEPEMNWSGQFESTAEDRAWQTLFGGREFRIDELRPEMQIQELARWRAEIVRLNKEDHLNYRLDSVNEHNSLVEQLEKSLRLDVDADFDALQKRAEDMASQGELEYAQEQELEVETEAEYEQKYELKTEQEYETEQELEQEHGANDVTDFNKILFGDESPFLLEGVELKADFKIRLDGWEHLHGQEPGEKQEQERKQEQEQEQEHEHEHEKERREDGERER